MVKQLLVATRNPGKMDEVKSLLGGLNIFIYSLADLGISEEVVEDLPSFRENAIKKATSYARLSGKLTLADDSGLEVDALNGRPGVRTARFGGPDLNPEERYRYLLELMSDVSADARSARFHCVVALASRDKLVGFAEGICEGVIALEPKGHKGFGYDPIFFLPELNLTMAQLDSKEKQLVSHRGKAIRKIIPLLQAVVLNGDDSR
jgi:XTP/dITP diphosphohydrolase